MFPNLFNATQEYWRKLDELEEAYKQDQISLEEVDMRVAKLMAELAQERRSAFNYIIYTSQQWLAENKNTLIGVAILVFATYAWLLTSFNNF